MISSTQQQGLKELMGDEVQFDVSLSLHTSIHIGGPAGAFATPSAPAKLQTLLRFARENSLPLFVLGKGSNTLVRDGGFPGIVVSLSRGFREFGVARESAEGIWVHAQGGVPTQQLVRWSASLGLQGLERLSGVPGTLGGNVFMNAGTYVGEVAELVEEVDLCDSQGRLQTLSRPKLKFDYRRSNIPPSSVVTKVLLKLIRGEQEAVEKRVREVFEKRGFAQPVEQPNLGSIFKNPDSIAGVRGKKKAWELIEEGGLKGVRVGGARVSEKHANFIVNEGGAKARDVLILINMIKERVKLATGIMLETEIKVIGDNA